MELTATPDLGLPKRTFVPARFDPENVDALTGAVDQLLQRPLSGAAGLTRYLHDWSELASLVQGAHARRGTASHRETSNAGARDRLRRFQAEVWPAWERLADRLNRRFLESPYRTALGREFGVFVRNKEMEAKLFREENTRLAAKEQEKVTDWEGVQGAISVSFEGRTLTREQCAAVLLEADRVKRERAYLALARRRSQDRARIDAIFDEILALRHAMARNAGYGSYVDYRFAQLNRFEYTPRDCEGFHRAVEEVVRPFAEELRQERARRLGVPGLRPYDLNVSMLGGGPPELFADEKGFIALARRHFAAIDARFAEEFDILARNGLLDLMSRPGKAPGGYNWGVEDIRLPFIFANAVGSPRDLQTLLHEGGHAFHTILARDLPLVDDRNSPAEFAEVASMGMEMLCIDQMPAIFDAKTACALAAEHLEGVVLLFGRVAHVDAFQHWLYRNPGHDADTRRAKWVELGERFAPGVDWSGLEEYAADSWQAIPHFFAHPLYFIEYGLAQLGALQLWTRFRRDPKAAVAAYRSALALGGSRTIPDLFAAAGLRFAMDPAIFREVIPPVMAEWRRLLA